MKSGGLLLSASALAFAWNGAAFAQIGGAGGPVVRDIAIRF